MKCKKIAWLLSVVMSLTSIAAYAEGLGVCTHVEHGYVPESNMEVVENADIKWIRDGVGWTSVESTKNSFAVPEQTIRYFKTAKENGVNVLAILAFGRWDYVLSDGTTTQKFTMPKNSETEYMEGWKEYVRTVATEVGDYIDAYEVWNEPDHPTFNTLVTNGMTDYSEPASVYADLYIATKDILDEIDPGKPVLFGSLAGVKSEFYEAVDLALEAKGKSFNQYIDDVSIHCYAGNTEDLYGVLSGDFEKVLDSYNFDGDVWLTETGISTIGSITNDYQAKQLPQRALAWEKYLKDTSRNGIAFWYDLRNDGTDASDKEDNFGIVDYNYNPKPAFNSMKAWNTAVNYMSLIKYERPQTNTDLDKFINGGEYGVLATFSDGVNTTCLGYDENENNKTIKINLSGSKAYVYDYQGNILEEIDVSVTSTYNLKLTADITYVVCVNPRVYFDFVNFDKAHNIITVNGSTSELDATGLEVKLQDSEGNIVYSEKVAVTDGKFKTEISYNEKGSYNLTAGDDVCEYFATETVTIGEREVALGDSVVSVNGNRVTVTGTVTGAKNGETISALVVPQTVDLSSFKSENIAYVDDVEIENGSYSFEFEMPLKSEGTYKILLSGKNISGFALKENVVHGIASDYVNVCNFDYTLGENTISVSAKVKNPSATPKDCTIIVAQYEADGRLKDVSLTPVTVDANTVQTVEKTASCVMNADASTAKGYIFDGLEGIRPLVGNLPIPLN